MLKRSLHRSYIIPNPFLLIGLIVLWLLATKPIQASISSQSIPKHRGIASWYSQSDPYINWRTANGEVFDNEEATCASQNFSFGTYVKVTNIQNKKFVICRVNDRGPKRSLNRAIDLTKSGFQKIADPKLGLAKVTITPLKRIDAFKKKKN